MTNPTLTVGKLRGIPCVIPPTVPVEIETVIGGVTYRLLLQSWHAEYKEIESKFVTKWPERVVLTAVSNAVNQEPAAVAAEGA